VQVGTASGELGWRLWALVPVVLLAVAVAVVVSQGDRVVDLVGGSPPPADELDVRRVELRPGEIRIQVRNPQREDITIASVTVDDAIVPFTLDGPATLGRLRSRTVVVAYDWVAEEPLALGVTTSTGIQTTHEIAAAVLTPQPGARGFLGYGLIGLLVGVVPVALGLLWLPSLRRASPAWVAAFMALTAGLLTFLGVEALFEALELQAALPPSLGGPGLVLLGLAASALGMTFLSVRLSRGKVGASGLALALLVAIGIGIHNLGEGLAIGTSFATGELQLGAFLVIGFMVHNVTEGLGIAAPATRAARVTLWRLAGLALIAGAPAILGTWIGGYASSDILTPVFFALAAGAALQVVVEVARYVARIAPGGLQSGWAVGGFLSGIAAMWATGLLIG
jgi:zinc transporter, ZIP family